MPNAQYPVSNALPIRTKPIGMNAAAFTKPVQMPVLTGSSATTSPDGSTCIDHTKGILALMRVQ
jgi:hypothetical protein